ncbi:GNAT family N-acetyltransferase [Amphiplicatus metriothermophilus]|uniref:L-amino acid N-acyltransferase YncA n=1 Tax=Amphiplicatus metriothermophilus TaxID=1519374 RepID=A0A239PJ17_9PROT|nr:GNAT family N-acetyltransferase [Amphiplicatus metriothermophilus]MBB5518039.1 RimJ/RimL family protein N-acetyltransferase [Amphiplicatus metriothermophilus]SNT67627.1 L-amino acid N-acyltransferase YncA [Amphiplicatus metriothermophilus]
MLKIQPLRDEDWPTVWAMLEPVFRAGETYPCDPAITEEEARLYWAETTEASYVARDAEGRAVGAFYIRPDQPGLGDHVCNCGYVVAESARGRGLAVALCRRSQEIARERGYRAMKFNLVIATNEAAVRAWLKSGMRIIGTVPKAFRHARLGLVDAHIMYKEL